MSQPSVRALSQYQDIQSILDWLLRSGIDLSQTSFGHVQLVNWMAGYLEIRSQRGFGEEFLSFFERVRIEDGSACARALRQRQTIVIEDIMTDGEFSGCREIVANAGVRAVQSTPMVSKSGAFIGVMSTYFAERHRPSLVTVRELRHVAQLAADAIIRVKGSGRSIGEQIKRSVGLLEQSRSAIARADALIGRDPWSR
jgi:GAF domain-containing protein